MNDFKIIITGVDRATAVFRKINRSMEQMTRPVTNLKRSLASFAKEAHLDKVGKAFMAIGKGAVRTAASIARALTPLAAIAMWSMFARERRPSDCSIARS